MDRTTSQNINKKMEELNNTIKYLYLMGIYRISLLRTAGYTFFSSAHGIISKIDHMIGHKTNINIFNRMETIKSMFSKHSWTKLYIIYRRKFHMFTNM